MNHHSSDKLLDNVSATGAGAKSTPLKTPKRSFQAYGKTTAGVGSVTVQVQVSDVENPAEDGDWFVMGSITLVLGTTKVSDGFTSDAPWRHIRGNVSAIAGTGATVTLLIGG